MPDMVLAPVNVANAWTSVEPARWPPMTTPLRVLVVGCGNMGASHARAYHAMPEFEVVGVVAPTAERRGPLARAMGGVAEFTDYDEALRGTRPDVVSINSYPATHAPYAMAALDAGCHVFCEKPLATTVADAEAVVAAAAAAHRKLVVGYILRVHPTWIRFIEIARTLGSPLVMRMNLNQQSHGRNWETHRSLMASTSPIVDCGVHYVDVMCQMTRARPVRVVAVGARLSDEIAPDMYNYGHLEVTFGDGSVGWYEAGWGPMMSQEAHFVKDVIGPRGSVSIVRAPRDVRDARTDDIDDHTKTECLRVHRADVDGRGEFAIADEFIRVEDEPDHEALCAREQEFLVRAIRDDLDLSAHLSDAVQSLGIVLAADDHIRRGRRVLSTGVAE